MSSINIDSIQQHQSVQDFIQRVVDKLYTSEDAFAIETELKDHILSLTEDYLLAGHAQDTAIRKALLQMGDPAEIGYSFTDFKAMKRRKYLRVGLKWAAVSILIIVFVLVIFLSGGLASESGSVSDDHSRDFEFILVFYLPLLLYMYYKNALYQMAIPINQIKINKTPLMILWPYKQRFQWEYVVFSLFFLPIFLIFVVIGAYEGVNPIAMMAFLAIIVFSIGLFFYSERFRIPKYMLLEEGLVIKNRLVSWASIDRVRWTRDYLANSQHYVLTLEHVLRNRKEIKTSIDSVKTNVYVNAHQYRQLSALLKEYLG